MHCLANLLGRTECSRDQRGVDDARANAVHSHSGGANSSVALRVGPTTACFAALCADNPMLRRILHVGAARGAEGKLWLKGDIIVHIEERRLDDPQSGEDPATAGDWIQYVDLWTRAGHPYIERYVFAPAVQ